MTLLLYCSVLFGLAIFTSDAASAPLIDVARSGSQLSIHFTGQLEAADSPEGAWVEITNATSPHLVTVTNTRGFFRAREGAESIFAASTVLEWNITGPLQTNFNRAYAGTPDGIVPPLRVKEYFEGHIDFGSVSLPVSLRVRGNSSLQECTFPKLKMKVAKENRPGTPFFDAREIKIGTHCADGGRGNIGRLRDERAAWREALAYEVMNTLGFTGPRVRRVIIDYHDTGAVDESGASGWQIARHAFIADDVEVVAQRLGGRALSDEEITGLKDARFDEQLVADLLFLHAFLGNWDFSLSATGEGLWNTEVIEKADKTLLPIAGDFDLASWVTENVRSAAPREYHPELGDVERQALYLMEGLVTRLSTEAFGKSRDRYLQHRTSIEAKVDAAEVDDAGRANAFRHIAAFYNALLAAAAKR